MEISMTETISASLEAIRTKYLGKTEHHDTMHHGEVMYLTGYLGSLMHSRTITIDQWGEYSRQRDEAHQFWKENRK